VEAVVVVSQNAYNIWQTVLAFTLILGSIAGLFRWLDGRIAKKGDIDDLSTELAAVKANNTTENNRIMAVIGDLKAESHRQANRIDRLVEKKYSDDEIV
jgi:hypothetical protein